MKRLFVPSRALLALLSLKCWLCGVVFAGELERPWNGEDKKDRNLDVIDTITVDPPSASEMVPDPNDLREQVAVELDVHLTVQSSGTTEVLPNDGGRIWRVQVTSTGALFLSFSFNAFNLKDGMEMRFYAPGERDSSKVITREYNNDLKTYGSPVVCGDTAIIELFMPDTGNPAFNVDTVSYGFEDFLNCAGSQARSLSHRELQSYPCLIDIECADTYESPDNKMIMGSWADQAEAVARTFDGTYLCSGAMIGDCTKHYFLTANHCTWSKGTANKLRFYWNLQCQQCANTGTGTGTYCDNPPDETTGGAHLLFTKNVNSGTDVTLLEIKNGNDIPSYVYYAGYDATNPSSPYAYGTYIHHPGISGPDVKKITQKQETINAVGNYWRCNVVDQSLFLGDSAGGSSGCPLFNPDRRIIGQLYGGAGNTCGTSGYDDFGRLDISWTLGLDQYLGPNNVVDGTYCTPTPTSPSPSATPVPPTDAPTVEPTTSAPSQGCLNKGELCSVDGDCCGNKCRGSPKKCK